MKNNLWVLFLMLIPQLAYANSMAPVFPLISSAGWLAMPIIISIEAAIYNHCKVNNPIKLSVYSNFVSAIIGAILSLISLPFMLGPVIDSNLPFGYYLFGLSVTFLAVVMNWWISSYIEMRFSKCHKLWNSKNLPISLFYKANLCTYLIILVWLTYGSLRKLGAG